MTINYKLLLILTLFFTSNFFAQNIITDRPDQTESSVTVGNKAFQIETGLLFQQKENTIKSFFGPSTLLRYGISKGIELRLMSQYESTKIELEDEDVHYSGLNDIEFGAKIQLLKKSTLNTEIAFLTHVIVPTAKEHLTSNNLGVINKLAISHAISNKIGIGYNIGYDYIENQSYLTYSLAIGVSLSEKLSFYSEPYGALGASNNFESNFNAGFTYLVTNNFQLDASYGFGINSDMKYISVGFSYKLPNFLIVTKS